VRPGSIVLLLKISMPGDPKLKQAMFDHIKQWQEGTLSQKEYCRQNNIAYHAFHYWYKRYRDEHGSSRQPSSFIRMQVEPSASSTPFVELLLVDGTRLLFHEPVSSDYLKAIIR
jgi:hypothetical protein